MKLLLFSREFLPRIGGGNTIVAELARGLTEWRNARDDHAVEITVVTQTPSPAEMDKQFSFAVIRQPGLWTVVKLILKSDIVHLAGPAMVPLALSLLLRKPVVVEHHGFQTICPNGQMLYEPSEVTCPGHFVARKYGECLHCNRKNSGLIESVRMLLMTPIRRWMCNRVHANIMPTHWLASLLGLKRQKVVWHGVQSAATGLRDGGIVASPSKFAYQGRLVSTKGIRVLLEAFEQLCEEGRSPQLIIIGGGPLEESLRLSMAKFGEQVQFLGQVPSDRLERLLAGVTTVVMPSLAGEVFGLVAAENMMRGKLVIVSDLGSLREVLGETGLIFPVGDAAALADRMRLAMDQPSRAKDLAQSARVRAERAFGTRRMVEEHIAIYREVLAAKE